MKSKIRKVYASGSTRRLVDKIIARGWQPGARLRDYHERRSKAVPRD